VVDSPKGTLKVVPVTPNVKYNLFLEAAQNRTGFILMLNYATKGTEDGLLFKFKNVNDFTATSNYLCECKDGDIKAVELPKLTVEEVAIPVPIPMPTDTVQIELTFAGDTSNVGVVHVEARYSDIYQGANLLNL
jgi:hypothetical protein